MDVIGGKRPCDAVACVDPNLVGKKGQRLGSLSWLCAPTKACHESACTVCGMIKAASIKSQRKRIGKWIDPKVFS